MDTLSALRRACQRGPKSCLTRSLLPAGRSPPDRRREHRRIVRMADEYQYLPLDARRKEVRLLCFSWSFSTDGTSTLACTIEHASLLDELVPEYFAVSYCWGDAKKRASILVNGKVMSIPRTAELALRYLHDITGKGKASEAIAVRSIHNKGLRILKAFAKRHISPQKDHPPVRLWIDAICINQKDVAERQQQVTFMRDVSPAFDTSLRLVAQFILLTAWGIVVLEFRFIYCHTNGSQRDVCSLC